MDPNGEFSRGIVECANYRGERTTIFEAGSATSRLVLARDGGNAVQRHIESSDTERAGPRQDAFRREQSSWRILFLPVSFPLQRISFGLAGGWNRLSPDSGRLFARRANRCGSAPALAGAQRRTRGEANFHLTGAARILFQLLSRSSRSQTPEHIPEFGSRDRDAQAGPGRHARPGNGELFHG